MNTNRVGLASMFLKLPFARRLLIPLFSAAILFAALPQSLPAQDDQQPPPQNSSTQSRNAPPYAQQSPEQLQQLVAPIALYPDALVAQILAAATFPEQVVEADRWVQQHPDLKGDALAQAVDQEPWDPSVKALAAFPSILGNMDKNLSWTSSLGDAYYNQQPDVMDAVQVMRRRAQESGNLKSTPQQTVADQNSTITIQSANPEVVYVPAYDPWTVYGGPIVAWPGWYPYPGIWFGGPYLSFGPAFGIGFFAGYGWGWPRWGFDWHGHYPVYNHARYYSNSRTFYNRNNFYRGGEHGGFNNFHGGEHGGVNAHGNFNGGNHGNFGGSRGVYNRPGATVRPFDGNNNAARGYSTPRGQSGTRSSAFSGYDHGGQARSFSSRGGASFGGGGFSHGGGGGSHGGGGRH